MRFKTKAYRLTSNRRFDTFDFNKKDIKLFFSYHLKEKKS